MVEEAPVKKRGNVILILVVLVVLVGSAAVTFLVFRDRFFGSRGPSVAASRSSGSDRTAAVPEQKPQESRTAPVPVPAQPAAAGDAGKPATSPGPAQTPAATGSPVAPVVAPSTESGKTQPAAQDVPGGKISLQAASFPSEASAKQFQDRLVQAGLPAYVVAADIPHRGKWYRVRAGKFASQEEARQAGESWRKRAAAAGINLQLVPCDY